MNKAYICYCGLYCENCAVMSKIAPTAKALYKEMRDAGFEDVIQFIPGGEGFWPFLKEMAEVGLCISCKDGGGDPGCEIRICAKEKAVEMCVLCKEYPCGHFDASLQKYPALNSMKQDNALLCEQGMDAWAELQDERRKNSFTYTQITDITDTK
jgi:hypothetical protein